MESKYHDGQNQMTPLPTQQPFSTVAYLNSDISGPSLQGSAFAPSSFPGNVSAPRVFPTAMPNNAEEAFWQGLGKEQIRLELEKDRIRREIIAGEMALGRRRELEEEVRREMAAERTVRIPMERTERFPLREQVSDYSAYFNQRMNNRVNDIDKFGGPQPQLPCQVDIRQLYSQTNANNKGKVIILAEPDVDRYGRKRKAVGPPTLIDDNKNLAKRPNKQWSCGLCQITATSEKGLNDHLQGKKHKAKEASLRRDNR